MSVYHPEWNRKMTLEAWTKGMKKSFITILSPARDKGISTLKIDHEMWNFFPKINRVIKVPPSMMMGSWMGSDFTNDDLVKENSYIEDHEFKLLKEDKGFYLIELKPKKETISVWGKIILKIEKKRLIPVSESFYDEKSELIREIVFDKVSKVGNKEIPLRMTLTPIKKEGQKTIIEYQNIDFDVELSKDIFSLKNLKKKR